MHDLGGQPAGPCPLEPHDTADWERRIDAMLMVLWRRQSPHGRFTVDEMRRHIESMDPQEYRRSGYYARWAAALAAMLMEHGVITAEELAQAIAGASGSVEGGSEQ